jgi:hypothetical protein
MALSSQVSPDSGFDEWQVSSRIPGAIGGGTRTRFPCWRAKYWPCSLHGSRPPPRLKLCLNRNFPGERPKLSRGCFGTRRDSSAFDCAPVSSILQSKTSAEAHRDSSVTEVARPCAHVNLEQHTFHSRPPAGQHLKTRWISYCANSHRPAGFILISVYCAKTYVSNDACERCGVCAED